MAKHKKNNKKIYKKDENFYYGSTFTLQNLPCDFVIDTIHHLPRGEKTNIYKIGATEGTIKFAYETQKGLVRLSNSTGMIEEENIMGGFLKLKPKDYPKFFEKNGFIFAIKKDEYQSLNEESIQQLIARLKLCVELMGEITNNNKSYKNILSNSLALFSAEPIDVKLEGKKIYSSATHPLYNAIYNNTRMTNDDYKRRLQNSNYDYEIKDSIFGTYIFDSEEYSNYIEDCNDAWLKRLVMTYVNKNNEYSKDEKYIIDTLFHYYYDFLPKASVDTELDDILKDGILAFAKLMVKEEIDHNIKGVHASYDTDKMQPKWNVDDLFTAMYMSLFYLRANNYIYKQCPHCGTYFIVSRTTSKKIYCTDRCRRNANAKAFRRKHQIA